MKLCSPFRRHHDDRHRGTIGRLSGQGRSWGKRVKLQRPGKEARWCPFRWELFVNSKKYLWLLSQFFKRSSLLMFLFFSFLYFYIFKITGRYCVYLSLLKCNPFFLLIVFSGRDSEGDPGLWWVAGSQTGGEHDWGGSSKDYRQSPWDKEWDQGIQWPTFSLAVKLITSTKKIIWECLLWLPSAFSGRS